MYRCHLNFYLMGRCRESLDLLRQVPPLERFTHSFSESVEPEDGLAGAADVIFADLRGMDARKSLTGLLAQRRAEAECIVLVDGEQVPELTELLPQLTDVWTAPLTAEAVRFRFQRWQERYRQRTDLWETRQYLDATIDNIPNLVWYKDKSGIHEKVNDSFCRTVNKTKEQVQGRGHAYIWDVEHDDPACIESEERVMASCQTQVSEETVQAGESTRLLTTYKSPLFDLDGSVMGTVGVAIDVTQERAYKQELIKKNQMLETVFTSMECGIMCHSLDGSRIISINNAALRILGYETEEELLRDGFDMVAASVVDEDKLRLRASIRQLKHVEDSVSTEYRVRHRDGEERHVMGNIKLIEEDGEMFYQRFLLDCTAQKLREKQEREAKERRQMELVQALTTDYSMVCFYDLDTGKGVSLRIDAEKENGHAFSDIFSDIFSGSTLLEESMERYIREYVCQEDQESLRQAVRRENLRKELSERPVFYAGYRMCVDGETRYYQIKAVRTGEWESQRGMVLGFRSVDEETRSEMEKRNLLQDALLQANRASKAKSVFLSNMSHDIRTPMNAIVGFTSLAISHIDRKDQVEEYLKKIMTSGNHLLSLINDILDMSRIESGKIHLDEELCSLPEILHGLHSIIQGDIHAKQLDLYIDAVDVLDEEIYCDKLRLNQVLLNLLSNAIKYTGAGGRIGMRMVERPSKLAGYAVYEFHIQDTGIGMSEEFVAHIFEPFERERNSTISGIQGTGLGMAITKNIVDMMNGTIEVDSKLGVGTEFVVKFTFRLPTDTKEPQVIPELENSRALVVDDDFNTCDSVSYMLQQLGMRVEWTLSGKEAVLRTRQAVTRKDSYDIYIVDWLIPDMNGIEVARRIRKETGGDASIILLTAYDWSDIEEEALAAGITGFCRKPLFLSDLRGCLQSLVSAEEQHAEEVVAKHHHTGRILLVEDNELNQEIAMELLTEAGFETEVAENGQKAIDRLVAAGPGHFQLVLMDVQMPVMGGYEATKTIRALPDKDLAEIPILAMTANAFEEDKREALKCGMNGHIAKPIDIENLMEMLEQVLK